MELKLLAHSEGCRGGKKFYDCRYYDFEGCCDVDPCEAGVCPDNRKWARSDSSDRGRDMVNPKDDPKEDDKGSDKDDDKDDGGKNGDKDDQGGSDKNADEDDKKEDDKDGNKNGDKDDKKDNDKNSDDDKDEESPAVSTVFETTIVSLAPPLQATPTTNISSTSTTTTVSEDETSSITALPTTTTTPAAETRPTPSPIPNPTSAIPPPSETDGEGEGGESSGGLSPGAMGGIFGAVGAVMIFVIVAFFLCGKRGRKLRNSFVPRNSIRNQDDLDLDDDPYGGKDGLQPYGNPTPGLMSPGDIRDDFARLEEARYGENPSQYTRACAFNSNLGRDYTKSPAVRSTTSLEPPPPIESRGATTPDFSRQEASTPELQGSPKRAAIAELASPGLPRIVQIPNNRHSMQQYKAYRPGAQLHPVNEANPLGLRGDLAASSQERSSNKYVNSWSRWDPST